jgi:cobalt-zinc-cadmium efflux system protein
MAHSHSHAEHDHNHDHDKHHGHSHAHSAPTSFNSAFAFAVAVNLVFVLFEASYALIAHSMSLLADAGHNFGDVLGLSLAWGANLLLARGASARYSYGFKRTTIIAALINALILVGATAIIAYESILKLLNPVVVDEKIIIIVAAIGILINGGTALLFMRGRKDDLNIKAAFLHLAYDALIAFGVVVAGFIILFTHALWLDPLVGLLIVIAIVAGTWSLLLDSVNLILDAVPKSVDYQGVKNYLAKIEGVTTVHDLHIWGLSTNEIALTAHLVMPTRELHDADFQGINHHLKCQFKINHVTIQVEKGTTEDPCGQVQTC